MTWQKKRNEFDRPSIVQARLKQLVGASSLLTVLCLSSTTESLSAPHDWSLQVQRHSGWHKYSFICSGKPTFTGEITLSEAVAMGLAADSERQRHAVAEQLPFLSGLCRSYAQSGLRICTDGSLAGLPASLAAYQAHRNTVALAVKVAYWEAVWRKAELELVSEKLKDKEERFAGLQECVRHRRSDGDKSREEEELVKVRRQVSDASHSFRGSVVRLAEILGVAPTSLLLLKEQLSLSDDGYELNDLVTEARTGRLEVCEADRTVRDSRQCLSLSMSRLDRNHVIYALARTIEPDINTQESKGDDRTDQFDNAIGDSLMVELDPLAGLMLALFSLEQAESARKQVQLNVAQDVIIKWIDFDTERRNVGIDQDFVRVCKQQYEECRRECPDGSASLLEKSQVADYFFDARNNLLYTLYRYKIAEARLLCAAGVL